MHCRILILTEINDLLDPILYLILLSILNLIVTPLLRKFRLPFGLRSVIDVPIGRDIGVRGSIHLYAVSIGEDALGLSVHLLPDGCIGLVGSVILLLPVGHFNDIILIKWIIC